MELGSPNWMSLPNKTKRSAALRSSRTFPANREPLAEPNLVLKGLANFLPYATPRLKENDGKGQGCLPCVHVREANLA